MCEFSLIANSGLQFVKTEAEFNPSEQVVVNGTPVSLFFAEYPSEDPNVNCFEMAYKFQSSNLLVSDLRSLHCIKQKMDIFGDESDELDVAGQPVVDRSKINLDNVWSLSPNQCYSEFNIEGAFQLQNENGDFTTPFEKILGKWLPVPMFEVGDDGATQNFHPTAWCRVRIDEISKGIKVNRYRLTWGFDTSLADDEYDQSLPIFPSNTHSLNYCICNRITQYLSFLEENSWIGDYMSKLIYGEGVMPAQKSGNFIQRCRHLAFYINLFTQLRLIEGACPDVKLFNRDHEPIKVDLVLDIGNSRTCGVIYEEDDFTSGTILSLRDMDAPWDIYGGSFDMRLAFHRASFGEGNMGLTNVFNWRSFLRIGEEAHRLISQEQKADGVSYRLTNHSSPKRYLWDSDPYNGKWEFLLTDDEPSSVQKDAVYVKRLSEQFKVDGTFRTDDDLEGDLIKDGSSFSRRSLMTMVMIEILQQANMQINSYDYLNVEKGRGRIDCARVINNIIITCPTAMSQEEQKVLRRCAHDAYIAIQRSYNPDVLFENYRPEEWEGKVKVIPSEADLSTTKYEMLESNVEWGYDEATCCQMVYLYSEIIDKYKGNCKDFIEAKGHVRPEFKDEGYDQKSLTLGSIDIGAGTTDLMICTYKYSQHGDRCSLTPVPLFWDSFNIAGDDILQEIVLRVVLKENTVKDLRPGKGSILNAIMCNLAGTNVSYLSDLQKKLIYEKALYKLTSFFSSNAPAMSYLDRIMRNNFNVQISVPIAQKMMDMMKNLETARDVSYEEIFNDVAPSTTLLDFFEEKFGFRLQDLKWSYSPEIITECIRSRVEPLIKQLAIILHTYNTDVVLLAGRPMSLSALTDLLVKFFPVSPDRLIRLLPKNDNILTDERKWNCYKVGRWFPTSDDRGYFKDLKPVVAVGAMVAYKASHGQLPRFQLDMTEMKKRMCSTANYIGAYNVSKGEISMEDILLTPDKSTAVLPAVSGASLPYFIGCKQINTLHYHARPLYALRLKSGADVTGYDLSNMRVTISRKFTINKEELILQNALDRKGQDITDLLELKIQSLVTVSSDKSESAYEHWLDNGAFNI